MDRNRFLALFWEFSQFIEALHTLYLDSVVGYSILHKRVLDHQAAMKSFLGNCDVATVEFQDTCSIGYGDLCGTDFRVVSMSPVMKQGDVKTRTVKDGSNCILMGRLCVVSAYTYWEVYLRKEVGIALGVLDPAIKDKEEAQPILNEHVRSGFWGDMRWLRHSILHENGIASSDICRCQLLKWFIPGDSIHLDFEKMDIIFNQMADYRNHLHDLSLPPSKPITISW